MDYQTGGTSTIGSNNLFPDLLRPSPQGPKISVPRNSGLPIQIELDVSVSRYIQISDKEKKLHTPLMAFNFEMLSWYYPSAFEMGHAVMQLGQIPLSSVTISFEYFEFSTFAFVICDLGL